MSDVTNKSIKEVAKDGSSLIFIVYTEAISILPIPQFWSVIFFLMLLTLGLDSSVSKLQNIFQTNLKLIGFYFSLEAVKQSSLLFQVNFRLYLKFFFFTYQFIYNLR